MLPTIGDGDQVVLGELFEEDNKVPFAMVGFNVILVEERIAIILRGGSLFTLPAFLRRVGASVLSAFSDRAVWA